MAQIICRPILIILVGFCAINQSLAIAEDYKKTIISDPSISRRCELLSDKRSEKIANKQRILALIERNKHLQKIAPDNKLTVKKKLETNLGHLEHELILTNTQIQYQEEILIRKGCPGINL